MVLRLFFWGSFAVAFWALVVLAVDFAPLDFAAWGFAAGAGWFSPVISR